MSARPKAVTIHVRERAAEWLSAVNLHWAGVAALGLTCLYLLIQMGFAWQQAQSQNADALAQQRVSLMAAKIAAKPVAKATKTKTSVRASAKAKPAAKKTAAKKAPPKRR